MYKRIGVYHYFLPTLKQGRKVIWDNIGYDGLKFLNHFPDELIARKREDEMKIETTNGSVFQIVGSDKFDAVMGTNPVGLIMSEYALQDPRAWDFFRPILRENKGWVIFLYTPRGKNHGFHLYKKAQQLKDTWFSQLLTVNDTRRPDGTPVLSEADIEQDRLEGMDEDMIQQEYYCSFEGGMAGQIYGRLMSDARKDGRVDVVPHDPNIPVVTFWDIGVRDPTTIWFAQFPTNYQVNFIDFYENRGEGVGFYLRKLDEFRIEKGYLYDKHYAPHDIDNVGFGTGESPKEIAMKLGWQLEMVERSRNINTGIQNVRSRLPQCHFDKENCGLGIDALESYHYEWDAKWKRYSDTPAHDWACHGADAFRTFGEGIILQRGGGMTQEAAQALRNKYVGGVSSGPLGSDDDYDDFFDDYIERSY